MDGARKSQCESSWCRGFSPAPDLQHHEDWLCFIPSHSQHIQEVLVGYHSLKHCNHCCISHKVQWKERVSAGWQWSMLARGLPYRSSAGQATTSMVTAPGSTSDKTHRRHQPYRPNSQYMGSLLPRFKSEWPRECLEKIKHSLSAKPTAKDSDLKLQLNYFWDLTVK